MSREFVAYWKFTCERCKTRKTRKASTRGFRALKIIVRPRFWSVFNGNEYCSACSKVIKRVVKG